MSQTEEHSEKQLVDRILAEAKEEAESITGEAREGVKRRREALEKRIAQIGEQADEHIAEETKKLAKRADAQIARLRSRAVLRRENQLYALTERRVRSALADLKGSASYPAVVRRWVVEAALGLGADEAVATAGDDELQAARTAIGLAEADLNKIGRSVSLSLDEEHPIGEQGVVLIAADGSAAYRNTVDQRIRRYGAQIRRIVYSTVVDREETG